VDLDEETLAAGIAGAVLATIELAGNDGITIDVTATIEDGELRTIDVAQHSIRVHGNWTANLAATVAKSAAHLTGGEAAFLAGEKRGSTVRFNYK
jgi:hypothetical protein